MKKLLIGFMSLVLCAGFAFAEGGPLEEEPDLSNIYSFTLKGVTTDPISNEALEEVKITLDDISQDDSELYGVYKIAGISPENHTITFDFGKDYYSLTGTLLVDENGIFSVTMKRSDDFGFSRMATQDPANSDTYIINIDLLPKPIEIISGTITAIRNDVEQELIDGAVTIKAFYKGNPINATIKGNTYSIKGHLGTVKIPRNYTVELEYSPYEKVVKTFTVEDKKLIGKLAKDIVFTNPSNATLRQDNLEAITGFGCDELMPKHLVGANCVENSDLKGDATDIAVWIQKFGSKITSLIGMIAVVLIVWNAFKLVTAAGEETQISEAKNGILWAIVGLAVTMFAYIIVKTVIVLTYTS